MRALIKQMCSEAGDDVREAANSEALMEICGQQRPDCIVLDESLGGGECSSLLRQIKALLPEVRVVLLSWEVDDWFQNAARSAGAWKCINKEDLRLVREAIREDQS